MLKQVKATSVVTTYCGQMVRLLTNHQELSKLMFQVNISRGYTHAQINLSNLGNVQLSHHCRNRSWRDSDDEIATTSIIPFASSTRAAVNIASRYASIYS